MINIDDRLIKNEMAEIGSDAVAVLLAITTFIDRKNTAFPRRAKLQKMTKLSRERVQRSIKVLCEKGLIKKHQEAAEFGKFGKIIYTITTKMVSIYININGESLEDSPSTDSRITVTDSRNTENRSTDSRSTDSRSTENRHLSISEYLSIKEDLSINENLSISEEKNARSQKNNLLSFDVKNQIQQENIFYDSPENRLKVWKMYQSYIESESFISHFEMSSEKYPNVEKTELMQTWVMRADWDSVKNVKINLIGNWIRIAEADFQKNKNKNGRSNQRLISKETANKVFTDRIRKLQEKDGY